MNTKPFLGGRLNIISLVVRKAMYSCDKKGSVWKVVNHATQVLLLNNLVIFGSKPL